MQPGEFERMEAYQPWGMQVNTFAMLMHLSQFAGVVVPYAGFVLPIVMWVTNKDRSPDVDLHGRIIVNWMISSFIYVLISAVLVLVMVGIVGLFVLIVLMLLFPIIGAVKANSGEAWPYPMSIRFFAV